MPDLKRVGCIAAGTGVEKIRPQSPASSRLRPSKAAKATTNRTAARVNVGVTGAKTGAATSSGGMMKTFDEFGEFWKTGASDN